MKKYRNKKEFKRELPYLEPVEVYKEVLSGRYIKMFPKGFWQQPEAKQNAIVIGKYLIEEKLKWSEDDIKEKLSFKIFKGDVKLGNMVGTVFEGSPIECICSIYPDKFKPWEFVNKPTGYWNKETAKEATKWLIEEKLKWSEDDVKENLNKQVFIDNKLHGMLAIVFNHSPYNAINTTYPDKFKPWELANVANNYWNIETAKEATRWLIEEKLKWSEEDVKEKLTRQVFVNNGLDGMIASTFKGSPYDAINNIYPGKFKPWELLNVSRSYWNEETAREATKWLIEEKLEWSEEDVKEKLTRQVFTDNGLGGMMNVYFNNYSYKAINNAYPGKFKKSDFKYSYKYKK